MWIVNAILLFILSFELALAGITVDLLHFFLFLFLYMLVEKQYEKKNKFYCDQADDFLFSNFEGSVPSCMWNQFYKLGIIHVILCPVLLLCKLP